MNYNQNGSGGYPNGDIPGKNKAIASLVLGIISVVLWFFGYSSILSIILGIIGLVLSSKAKEEGYDDNLRMAGLDVYKRQDDRRADTCCRKHQ